MPSTAAPLALVDGGAQERQEAVARAAERCESSWLSDPGPPQAAKFWDHTLGRQAKGTLEGRSRRWPPQRAVEASEPRWSS